MGRWNKIEIDFEVLEAMIELGATLNDCCGKFRCSDETISKRIKDEYDMTYRELQAKLMHSTRMEVRRLMMTEARKGNAAILIWLSKNWLDFRETSVIEQQIKDKIEIVIK